MKITLDGFMPWLMLAFVSLMLVLMPIQLRRHWKGTKSAYGDRHMSGYWYKSDEFRRGHIRATPIVMALGYAIALFALLLFVIPPVSEGNTDWPASIGLAAILACFVLAIPLYWTVMLFNKPKFLVAPYLRSQPGVLEEKRRKKN